MQKEGSASQISIKGAPESYLNSFYLSALSYSLFNTFALNSDFMESEGNTWSKTSHLGAPSVTFQYKTPSICTKLV